MLIQPPGWMWEHSSHVPPTRTNRDLAPRAQMIQKTHCKNGHPYTDNDYTGARYCRACENTRHQKRRSKT